MNNVEELAATIINYIELKKQAETSCVATWQPHFIQLCSDWCLYIETELSLLENEQEGWTTIKEKVAQTTDVVPPLTELLDAKHCFFRILLGNVFLSNSNYLYIMGNYDFLTISEPDILQKDLSALAHNAATKNILADMLKELQDL